MCGKTQHNTGWRPRCQHKTDQHTGGTCVCEPHRRAAQNKAHGLKTRPWALRDLQSGMHSRQTWTNADGHKRCLAGHQQHSDCQAGSHSRAETPQLPCLPPSQAMSTTQTCNTACREDQGTYAPPGTSKVQDCWARQPHLACFEEQACLRQPHCLDPRPGGVWSPG